VDQTSCLHSGIVASCQPVFVRAIIRDVKDHPRRERSNSRLDGSIKWFRTKARPPRSGLIRQPADLRVAYSALPAFTSGPERHQGRIQSIRTSGSCSEHQGRVQKENIRVAFSLSFTPEESALTDG
jgi:hypothetical protein